MANLLSKFRIEYKSLKMIENISDEPKEETKKFFENSIQKFTDSNEGDGKLFDILLVIN